MPAILMTKEQIQAMIALNKKMITALELERQNIQSCIDVLWNASDPMSTSVDSKTAFECLNISKDNLRDVKKKIKLLSKFQYALKHYLEF